MWPSSISEPSVSTARLVVWPSTIEPFFDSVSTSTQRPKLGSIRACFDDIHLSGTRIVSSVPALLGAALGAATELDDGEVGQPIAHRAGARPAAFEREHEHRLRAWPDAAGLAIRVDAEGRAVRVAHVGHLTTVRPASLASRRGRSRFVARPASALPGARGLRRATSATAWYERGLRARGESTRRRRWRRTAARSPADPTSPTRTTTSAGCSTTGGELAAAEALLPARARARPTVALYWFNLGVALEDQGRASEAIAAYERAALARWTAHFNLARARSSAGAHGRAPRRFCGARSTGARRAYCDLARVYERIAPRRQRSRARRARDHLASCRRRTAAVARRGQRSADSAAGHAARGATSRIFR